MIYYFLIKHGIRIRLLINKNYTNKNYLNQLENAKILLKL